MTKDKPKAKDVSGFSVGRKHDPKLAGPGWVKKDGKDAGTDVPRDGWKPVKKDDKK